MPTGKRVEIGDRFKPVDVSAFGRPLRIGWRVSKITRKAGGFDHAQLVSDTDPIDTKTISVGALLDTKLFERIAAGDFENATLQRLR